MISDRYSSAALPPGQAGPADRDQKGHPEFRVVGGAGQDARPRRWAATKRAEVGDPVALRGLHQVRSAGGGVALAQPPVARAHFADAAPLSSSSRTRADVRQRHTYSGSGPEFPSTDAPRRQQHRYVGTSTCASNHARTPLGSYRR